MLALVSLFLFCSSVKWYAGLQRGKVTVCSTIAEELSICNPLFWWVRCSINQVH